MSFDQILAVIATIVSGFGLAYSLGTVFKFRNNKKSADFMVHRLLTINPFDKQTLRGGTAWYWALLTSVGLFIFIIFCILVLLGITEFCVLKPRTC